MRGFDLNGSAAGVATVVAGRARLAAAADGCVAGSSTAVDGHTARLATAAAAAVSAEEARLSVRWRWPLQRSGYNFLVRVGSGNPAQFYEIFGLISQVRDIPCGTKGGVMISFDKIEVHWIDEKVKDSIQADCTRYAPGIEIISVRVTKPNIPVSIKRNFELMEEERTKALIAIEKQKVAEKEAETQKKIALSEADKIAQVSRIQMEQKLMEKNSTKRQEEIENEMYIAREKSQADANFYRWATVMLIG
ncbi:hypothetical protein B296_00020791 [Ensete ventricosum]|uniref:Band 7 domain-containing protein n=1 Tax=Ensete ventricosum TaxID=4639 RepID=A0A426ZXZ7_ENSVE|nr:hypothetical protein B296_00020791 [Ensete ventricosum]